jgi:SAM-dependent methyltransferase
MPDAVPPSALMPPGPMRHRVAGTDNRDWFHVSGRMTCELYEAAMTAIGRDLAEFRNVLDFGCGVGRVLRWLQVLMPDAHFTASDSDDAALAWIRDNYPGVDTAAIASDGLPPLHIDDGRFDLVLGYSVFTHLNVQYQDAWLPELRRLVRPGGILLLSISGPRMLDKTLTKSEHPNLADLKQQLDRFTSDGILHWLGDGWEQHQFPAYYHTTFHSHQYVRDHWSRWFTVLGIESDTPAGLAQDIVTLRRD